MVLDLTIIKLLYPQQTLKLHKADKTIQIKLIKLFKYSSTREFRNGRGKFFNNDKCLSIYFINSGIIGCILAEIQFLAANTTNIFVTVGLENIDRWRYVFWLLFGQEK